MIFYGCDDSLFEHLSGSEKCLGDCAEELWIQEHMDRFLIIPYWEYFAFLLTLSIHHPRARVVSLSATSRALEPEQVCACSSYHIELGGWTLGMWHWPAHWHHLRVTSKVLIAMWIPD
eukprot:1646696-Pleurochrysis_carterae.AAC.1